MSGRVTGPWPPTARAAVALRSRYYFTGKPCGRGHVAPRQTSNHCCVACAPETWGRHYNRHAEHHRARSAARHAELCNDADFRESAAARSRQWARDNKDRHRANVRNRKARKRAAEGRYTAADIATIMRAQVGVCAYFDFCGNDLSAGYHVDHIRALVRGGSNWPENLQLTCPRCNTRKKDRDPIEFQKMLAREAGVL